VLKSKRVKSEDFYKNYHKKLANKSYYAMIVKTIKEIDMARQLCIVCHEWPVLIQKRQLCGRCYQKERKKTPELFKPTGLFVGNRRASVKKAIRKETQYSCELIFARNFFNHKNYIYEAVTFHLDGINYTPDFYDQERNVFIEVAGTKQAFYANLPVYRKIVTVFGSIIFEFRKTDGSLIDIEKLHPFSEQS